MSGNSIGKLFVVTTFGESHGAAIGGVVDGCPPGLALDAADLQKDLDRRRPGQSKHVSQRKESDQVEILSGVFEGHTTGTPIGLLIRNEDAKSKDYEALRDKFRPGHADFTYHAKYGIRDHRGGGRASARETAIRVAAGAIARKVLATKLGVEIRAFLSGIGELEFDCVDATSVSNNPFFCPDPGRLAEIESLLKQTRKNGDSIGAAVTVRATGVPPGLGEPVFDRLDADIAKAMMSINAAKGVEIGAGFAAVRQRGSEHRDEITPDGFLSNHAGGMLGGISTGQDIDVRVAFKPTSSIPTTGKTIDTNGEQTEISTGGRHDPCVGIRAVPIVEAMLAIVLLDHFLRHRGQNADVGSRSLIK